MKIENRRYVVVVEYPDGTIQYAHDGKYGRKIGFTDTISKAKNLQFKGRYFSINVDRFRKEVIEHMKYTYKRSERPRTFIKRVV